MATPYAGPRVRSECGSTKAKTAPTSKWRSYGHSVRVRARRGRRHDQVAASITGVTWLARRYRVCSARGERPDDPGTVAPRSPGQGRGARYETGSGNVALMRCSRRHLTPRLHQHAPAIPYSTPPEWVFARSASSSSLVHSATHTSTPPSHRCAGAGRPNPNPCPYPKPHSHRMRACCGSCTPSAISVAPIRRARCIHRPIRENAACGSRSIRSTSMRSTLMKWGSRCLAWCTKRKEHTKSSKEIAYLCARTVRLVRAYRRIHKTGPYST